MTRLPVDMERSENTVDFKRRNDIILIIVLLFISAAVLVYLFFFRSGGNTVRVTIDGELYGVFSLSQNITENIPSGKEGTEHNCLVIKDGRAQIRSASCPDGICVSHSPIFRNGESIVCLPNRVVVTVFTDKDADVPDIIV